MSPLVLILLPAGAAAILAVRGDARRSGLFLVMVSLVTTVLAAIVVARGPAAAIAQGYLRLDATAGLFLAFVNPIFLGVSLYAWSRFTAEPALVALTPRFVPRTLVFLAATNTVFLAHNLLLAWIALEVTTLAVAPLIARPGHRASTLASWRYLLFSTVGLGLAFLGFLCLARGIHGGEGPPDFFLDTLASQLRGPHGPWSRLGVALVLLGVGTKLGLAPMYSWLPEAYDEAPPAVAALLGGVQFNAALLLLLRVVQLFRPTHAQLVNGLLIVMGLLSMVVSTTGIVSTRNMKRLIAYASINHVGVIALGIGVGRDAAYGVLLYAVSNAFIKTILLITAGEIKARYHTKDTTQIAGLLRDLPYSGVFLMVGTFALLGFPPYGSFFGELLILSALVGSGHLLVFAAFCLLISITFIATGRTVFPMIWAEPRSPRTWARQNLVSALPKLVFLGVLVVLGVYIPRPVHAVFRAVALSLGGA